MKSITYKKLLQLDNPPIYDIRPYHEYQHFHIKNALQIDNFILMQDYEKILKLNITYYLICQSGCTSKTTAIHLRKMGYDVISVQNGYDGIKQL